VFDEKDVLRDAPLIPPPDIPSPVHSQSPPPTASEQMNKQEEEKQEVVLVEQQVEKEETPQPPAGAPPVIPIVLLSPIDSDVDSNYSEMKKSVSTASFLSGTWRHLQEEDNFSLSSSDDRLDVLSQGSSTAADMESLSTVDTATSDDVDTRLYFQPQPQQFQHNSGGNNKEEVQYLFLAAELIGAAQQSELRCDYHAAFVKYKAGIGTLLEGVQRELISFFLSMVLSGRILGLFTMKSE
jgi:hypothetical protein